MMTTKWTEQTTHRATLIENARLEQELAAKTMELQVAMELQAALSQVLKIMAPSAGMSTKLVLALVRNFYDGDYE